MSRRCLSFLIWVLIFDMWLWLLVVFLGVWDKAVVLREFLCTSGFEVVLRQSGEIKITSYDVFSP